ncbi:hypothetical protein ACJ41O_009509 [Fusarium nematophilum]
MYASGSNSITNRSIVNRSVDDVSFKTPGRSEDLRPPRQTRTTGQTRSIRLPNRQKASRILQSLPRQRRRDHARPLRDPSSLRHHDWHVRYLWYRSCRHQDLAERGQASPLLRRPVGQAKYGAPRSTQNSSMLILTDDLQ